MVHEDVLVHTIVGFLGSDFDDHDFALCGCSAGKVSMEWGVSEVGVLTAC